MICMNHLGFSIISITNFCSRACVNTGQNLLLSDSGVSLYYIIFFLQLMILIQNFWL